MANLSHKIQKPTIILTHITTLTGLILMAIWCGKYLGGFSTKKGEEFNWHPFCMYFGFMFCFGHAALVYRLLPFEHLTKKIIHLLLQTLGMISVSLGLSAVIIFHNQNKYAHFYSLHSWLGIAVYAIFVLQYLSSFISFFYPKISPEKRAAFMPWHMLFGSWLYIAVGIVCLLGMQEKLGFLGGDDACSKRSTVCKIGNSIGVIIFISVLLLYISLYNFNKPMPYDDDDVEDEVEIEDDEYQSLEQN